MEKFERDYEADVKINRFKLDEECEYQSSIVLYWGEQRAELKAILDRIKTKLKYTKAEKLIHYTKNPVDGVKPTGAAVEAMVNQDELVNQLREQRTNAQKDLDIIDSAVNSLEHKRSQLKSLTELSISGYYARPTPTPKQDEVANTTRENLNKKKDDALNEHTKAKIKEGTDNAQD